MEICAELRTAPELSRPGGVGSRGVSVASLNDPAARASGAAAVEVYFCSRTRAYESCSTKWRRPLRPRRGAVRQPSGWLSLRYRLWNGEPVGFAVLVHQFLTSAAVSGIYLKICSYAAAQRGKRPRQGAFGASRQGRVGLAGPASRSVMRMEHPTVERFYNRWVLT